MEFYLSSKIELKMPTKIIYKNTRERGITLIAWYKYYDRENTEDIRFNESSSTGWSL